MVRIDQANQFYYLGCGQSYLAETDLRTHQKLASCYKMYGTILVSLKIKSEKIPRFRFIILRQYRVTYLEMKYGQLRKLLKQRTQSFEIIFYY